MSQGKRSKRKSIIAHTTTCPECGRRVLPKNLDKHIREQHPDIAATNKFADQITSSKPNTCRYCAKEIPLHELEQHIIEKHPSFYKAAERRAKTRVTKEEAKRKNKLERIAKKYDAPIVREVEYDGDAPWEWRLAGEKPGSRSKSNARTDPTMDRCKVCGVPVKTKNMKKHLRKIHGHYTASLEE